MGEDCCVFSERCSMGFSHAEGKAIAEHELVLCMYSYMFIHRLICSFSVLFPDDLNLNITYWKFHRILVNS